MKEQLQDQTILITGASMGIGEAIARVMAARGAKLILAARSEERLKQLCNELSSPNQACRYIACDLTSADDVNRLCEKIIERGVLDGIVHNAGVINYEYFANVPETEIRKLFEVNFFAILSLTQKLLPLLEKSPSATIAMISSAASWRSLPRWSLYCASKAALTRWAEALRMELKPKGVRVVTIYPGVTKTELSHHTSSEGPKPFATTEGKGISPEKVATKVVRAYEKGRRDEYVAFTNRLYRCFTFIAPRLFDYFFIKYYKQKGWS